MRRTKIVSTIGPATASEEQPERLMLAGMNVARLNFSHGTQNDHAIVIERIRSISARLGCSVAILQDLQGPKIRTGLLKGGRPARLFDGSKVILTTLPIIGDSQTISTTYKDLPQDVKAGDRILLDDGLIELRVLDSNEIDVSCLVVHGGLLNEHKGINLPGVEVSAAALTEKDREDLRFGLAHDVDYVALSFVRKPEDVLEAKKFIRENLTHPNIKSADAPPPLIAKLEKPVSSQLLSLHALAPPRISSPRIVPELLSWLIHRLSEFTTGSRYGGVFGHILFHYRIQPRI